MVSPSPSTTQSPSQSVVLFATTHYIPPPPAFASKFRLPPPTKLRTQVGGTAPVAPEDAEQV